MIVINGINEIRLSRDRARDLTEQYILSRAPGTMLLLVVLQALYLSAQHKRQARERRCHRHHEAPVPCQNG